ncbi:helix-turn-helix transcriptional regulator [uncultured Zhongshania sp.]|jgi:transcriptional regulator with XRE-family HTH domain|uniref:helix-turn-helix domain-containing protein n=1 Tax=uncultured Zhongshania sp. TaxID=1642288 RepID=UPI0030DB127C
MPSLSITLGAKIRAMRNRKGFSQDGLALQCGLDRSYMGRIERGEVNITVEKLYQISELLDCEPADLLPRVNEVDRSARS